ncbi:MAG: MmcQ/YjbR family DNA-binding protein [Acidobacteria bacterium]|nr:MmcQ/YjbR family DNA-binding protein [Acidobacteriota bacterium]
MTADQFRALALDLQGAVEGAHMGHPDFRVNGRIFASLDKDERAGMVKLSPEEQREFMRAHPGMFDPASGTWGLQGYTTVHLAPARAAAARSAMLLAWQAAVTKPPAKKRRPGGAGRPAAGRARRR